MEEPTSVDGLKDHGVSFIKAILLFVVFLSIFLFTPKAIYADWSTPKYILLNTEQWQLTSSEVSSVLTTIQPPQRGPLYLGMQLAIDYLNGPEPNFRVQQLVDALELAKTNNMPIAIKLDGENWWSGRPDLWYWWDPGISPAEKQQRMNNVEWSTWNSSSATRTEDYVRNWGQAQRMNAPQPNLLSPAYLQASKERLSILIPIILNWYNELSPDKKHLLAGVVFGWEASVGWSYMYCPSPITTIGCNPNTARQVGYAALTTSGIKTSGTITKSDITNVVQRYLDTLTSYAVSLGLPKDISYTHALYLESYSGPLANATIEAGIVPNANPGWSFYSTAYNPGASTYMQSIFSQPAYTNRPWAASEWLYIGGNAGTLTQQWVTALKNTLNYHNNRFLVIYNWSGIKNNSDAISAIKNVLATYNYNTPPPSTPTPTMAPSPTASPTVTATPTKPGDINGDGVVNVQDYQLLSNSFGKSQGDTGYDPRVDLNKDNTINIQDYQILSNNYGR